MTRPTLFLDAGVLIAAATPSDAHRSAALRLLDEATRGHWRAVHTSEFVVAEALNFVRAKVRRDHAARAIAAMVHGDADTDPIVDSVIHADPDEYAAAFASYLDEFDRGLSFTDWTTVVLAERAGATHIATFAQGFRGLFDVVDGT